jgi:multiple sugar transport system ATP-binding protein
MTLAHRVALLEQGKLQQLATPKAIYDDPETLFVAQFIGSPPMNVARGALDGGTFKLGEDSVETGMSVITGEAMLGVRAEDCQVVDAGKGKVRAKLYTNELIGDHRLVTAETASGMFSIKAEKDFEAKVDAAIGIDFDISKQYLFDAATGQRMR